MERRKLGLTLLVSYFAAWLPTKPWLQLYSPVFVFVATCWPAMALDLVAEPKFLRIISRWIRGDNTVAAAAILAVFDLVYALPLLFTERGRAYKRLLGRTWKPLKAWWWASVPSTLIAVSVTFFVTYHFTSPGAGVDIWTFVLTYLFFTSSSKGVDAAFWSGVVVNIISDYLALFVARRWLVTDGIRPLKALFFAPLAGILLVISFTGLRLVFFIAIKLFFNYVLNDHCYPFPTAEYCEDPLHTGGSGWKWDETAVQSMWPKLSELQLPGVLAACVVHLWLPVFALLAFTLQSLDFVRKAVESFVGRNHPVLALGVFTGLLLAAAALVLPQGLEYLHQGLAPLRSKP